MDDQRHLAWAYNSRPVGDDMFATAFIRMDAGVSHTSAAICSPLWGKICSMCLASRQELLVSAELLQPLWCIWPARPCHQNCLSLCATHCSWSKLEPGFNLWTSVYIILSVLRILGPWFQKHAPTLTNTGGSPDSQSLPTWIVVSNFLTDLILASDSSRLAI